MPAEIFGEKYTFLSRKDLLSFEEITRVARISVGLGARKLRLTGGEPLVRQQVEVLVEQLAQIDGLDDLAMTTNAYLLPQKARALKVAGLRRITVSLDSLDNDVFRHMNGDRADVADVLAGLDAAEQAGFAPIKINAVVQRGVNDHTVVDLARFCKERGYIARFIEYMDVGTLNGWRLEEVVPADEVAAMIHAAMPLEPLESNYHGEVARRYRYADGQGEIGLITSVTKPFCGACTRLRLSPEGRMFTCLFGVQGTDLREPLRACASDEEIAQIIGGTWQKRADRYSELRSSMTKPREKVEMFHIGG
jgi:cyclic pyranopterin phosphate synthase